MASAIRHPASVLNVTVESLSPFERPPELPIAASYPWPDLVPLPGGIDRDWAKQAINLLQGDGRRSADTHLVKPAFRGLHGISVYLKDESTHPTGSLKHRLARSLFL
jgi:hypothetical protein